MNNLKRREAALKLLAESGIGKGLSVTLIHKLYWWLGLNVRPPHFEIFWKNVLLIGVPFGLFYGIYNWFRMSLQFRVSLWNVSVLTVAATVVVGFILAAFYAYDRSKHHLPKWEETNDL
jgi:hypothetical protein